MLSNTPNTYLRFAGQREFASRRLLEALAARPQPKPDAMLLSLQWMASCFWTDSNAGVLPVLLPDGMPAVQL
jgi:hypothetical protein